MKRDTKVLIAIFVIGAIATVPLALLLRTVQPAAATVPVPGPTVTATVTPPAVVITKTAKPTPRPTVTVTKHVSRSYDRPSPGHNWEAVANCETENPATTAADADWDSTKGMFEGGLQFLNSTWLANGGGKYAQHAYDASRSEQISIAEHALAGSTWQQQWPICGKYL